MLTNCIRFLLIFLTLAFLFQSCTDGKPAEKTTVVQRDTTITKENSFSDLFLDSVVLEQYIIAHKPGPDKAQQLREFYGTRNYQFAWFSEGQLTQKAHSFWNLHNRYLNYSKDSSFFDKQLHQQMQDLIDNEDDLAIGAEKRTEIELELTEHFFDYAPYAYSGKIDPEEINWHIPRKKVDAMSLLDSLIGKNGTSLDTWEPLNQQYKKVREELLRFYKIKKEGGWPPLKAANTFKKGDSSAEVSKLKQRLYLSGDFANTDTSQLFTEQLELAVKRVQKRFGLKEDGAPGQRTIERLNIPVEDRIEQLLVNMERMRWMPLQAKGIRVVANIPEFKLHVYEDGIEAFQMKIVVGKSANRTVIFADRLQYVVFSPYWNVPRSIVRSEILPAMKKNPSYLSKQNMEQTGTSNGLPVIRQKPGAGNALGKVKFIFPNSYNIYFHDTPAKSLFNEYQRAFSHGCIRLEEPRRLAEYLLKNRKEWTEEKITKAMNSAKEQWVKLNDPVDVVISYFTAWVDDDGLLNFRDDIYGHDKELKERLFR